MLTCTASGRGGGISCMRWRCCGAVIRSNVA
nr:MAG TPA: BTK motif protein [Caudoviricetes sp.]